MEYTLLIGNNFISNSPKKIMFYDKLLFALNKKNDGDGDGDGDVPSISAKINNNLNKTVVEVNENKCTFCDANLIKKRDAPEHVVITEESGEIVFESRILDKKTLLVSGTFYIEENQKMVATQNYIILPSGKWIMHDRIDSNNKDVVITNEGIKVSD
jgi:hypothetical protein